MADSCCSLTENKILLSYYPSIKKKKNKTEVLPGVANQRAEWGPSPLVTGGVGWVGAVALVCALLGKVCRLM